MKNCHKSCPYRHNPVYPKGTPLCIAVDIYLCGGLSTGPCLLLKWIENKQKILAEVEALPEPEENT